MGEVFAGRYELVDPIGRGGVGAVWRAWDHRRRRYVAAKVLQQSDAHSLLRFVREQALRIDHPHVLAPASWAADDDKVLFTMDLVAGGSLAHLIGDYGPLPPSLVCTLLDQLLSGLAAVHAEDVVHRDIKPANVLLEATGTGRPRLRLSDFGIAMRLGEPRLTETNLVVGTPGYISPEQMMGSEPDFPADLFAVGLVALYLLEGAKPDAKALVQYFAAHGTPSAPKGIPEPLWQVVATLVQPDPQARFRTATGARKALAAAAELLPEPGPDDELIEIFDQLGPLPPGFGPAGPLKPAPGVRTGFSDTGQGWDSSGSGTVPRPLSGQVDPGPSAGFPAPGQATPGPDTGVRPSAREDDPASAWPGTDSVPADPRRGHTPGAVPPDPRQSTGPRPAASPSESSGAAQPPSMSDTGSFPLPPPQATGSSPQLRPPDNPQTPAQTQQGAQHQPSRVSPDDPTHVLPSPRPQAPPYPAPPLASPPLHRADASTASYTAQVAQVPPPAQETSRHRAGRGARRARRRPGPPAKVVVPMLLLALACYAVGFWALTRI
ncbi:protein kinase domain-containing protein [Streptomyces sp. WM6386]|uniref:protein kinase domain-containing protein n=1 Tax=Streptomyces sp. WM6386 TaxID=1415558 RepID=UPI0006198DBE|nr:serine/threonine-protein kinase [Streptomyces sp. WM6386]KKD09667.1 serine/threonine protein kinase [Streptomyces sp. WM6386]